jgi:hypothetical protein
MKDDPMTLKTLFARLRASLSFGGFHTGGFVIQAKLDDQRRELRRLTLLKNEIRRVNFLNGEMSKIRCGTPIPVAQGIWAPMKKHHHT